MGKAFSCPCCGAILQRDPLQEVSEAVSPVMAAILRALSRGGRLNAYELAEKVYADHPDGGPLSAAIVMRTVICRDRKKIEPFGFRLCSAPSHGGGYWLERLT
jgi:hypothetical protein